MDRELEAARSLLCVADGLVMPVGELGDGVYSRRTEGDGYAVLCRRRFPLNIADSGEIAVCSPADGVLTEINGSGFRLCTDDGIPVSVVLGEAVGARFHSNIGEHLSGGEPVCTVHRGAMEHNGRGGAAIVLLTDTDGITELYISAGARKAGDRTAFYRLNGAAPDKR